ncbi:carbamoyltransferase C-terminal domain-containing protein [Streptomyces roseifaciens]|uniref:carbamoyltransferase C-terminal domain-containing protein n=1 Tax=Streptomyces roseifaciens TaxID=1488406 RepID=UPI0007180673|nr:carbamoyltransferase C-terminal domain-containing protein [Streptomyces roseifaciens]
MLIFAVKPGHDGTIAIVRDRKLLYSLEAEKDSGRRYAPMDATGLLEAAELAGDLPDVVALGGWQHQRPLGHRPIGAGYAGHHAVEQRPLRFFGKDVRYFSSSHERSHIMMALGMAPPDDAELRSVLVWEGATGAFYVVDRDGRVVRHIPVLDEPGGRYAFLYAVADPSFEPRAAAPRLGDAGKLMALAAYAEPGDADREIVRAVDRILALPSVYPPPKEAFRDTPLYDAGVESPQTKAAAALLSNRLFGIFADAARTHLPAGTPLLISGGCGLNCDWNALWADLGHFSSVFVPPVTNDSGSAIGTAADALAALTGDPHLDWNVYSGLDFVHDTEPDPAVWHRSALDHASLARAIGEGAVVAWVQGRWEIGPRALGHRSLLAEPFRESTKERLNAIKKREDYRPIAPCCRVEDTDALFHGGFEDPYMLYFRKVRSVDLRAVTHVDGSARVQTVSPGDNAALHTLLSAFAAQYGAGVLCNTSLNFNGHGFINHMSDLTHYCQKRGVDIMAVGDQCYRRR